MKRSILVFSVVSILVMLLVTVAPASAAPRESAGGSGCGQWYTVRHGDSLYRIAVRFHTTVSALTRLNGISNPNRIYAGQVLCVAPSSGGGGVPWGFLYTVQRGDTLFSIARRFGWSASYLASVNHLYNPNQIYAGQVLLIPYH